VEFMDRINQILEHHTYRKCLQQIRRLEAGRIFCGHDMAHLLDVARLAYIFNLEEGLGIAKEQVYAAALLHDIGRHIQYLKGIPHHEAGILPAKEILADCGFSKEEEKEILEAILSHRNSSVAQGKNLTGILYLADKKSRSCFSCKAEPECDRSRDKKIMKLEY